MRKTYVLSQVLHMIIFKKIQLCKLRLKIIKRGISHEKYERYNNETYEEKYLRRNIMTRHKRKTSNQKYKGRI